MDLGLKGKVALVSAGSKGLGAACALGFAREGASVAICSRDADTIAAQAAYIRRETGAAVLAVQADVSKPEDVTQFVSAAVAEFGRIDTLVCNAGGPPTGGFEQLSDAQWLEAVDLTMLSAIRLMRAALPHLKASGTGRIVQIQSTSIKQPIAGLMLSNTLRLGMQGLVKTCADEFAPYGILINTAGPGRMDTDRVRSVDAVRAAKAGVTVEEWAAKTAQQIPLGRYGDPEEFARYVTFLGSPANTYMTGQALIIDGGMTRAL
jgi:3-oxoacyl-[acyl-carrier protein] reductase